MDIDTNLFDKLVNLKLEAPEKYVAYLETMREVSRDLLELAKEMNK